MLKRFRKTHLGLTVALLISGQANASDKVSQKDEADLEKLQITTSPLGGSALTSTTPVSILSGEALEKARAATLGDTLNSLPGVTSNYFGPVASSPIIRGLDGPRVKILQNGLDVSDASRVGPDHFTTVEASTATQIEVLRGPSTLLFGSGAIGGIVNVVDNRLPQTRRDEISGKADAFYDSVSNEKTLTTELNGGKGELAWHFNGFTRSTDDFEVPEFSAEDGDKLDSIENSFIDADGFTFGGGWIGDDVNLALSFGTQKSQYGIPGHGHEEEEGHEEEGEEHEGEDEHGEEDPVFADLSQDRVQFVANWTNLGGFFTDLHWHNAYTDYQHSEIEDGAPGTTFKNDTLESRFWGEHKEINGWRGVLGLHYTDSDFAAEGDEAFTPSTQTDTLALFLVEERKIDNTLWQLGARVERTSHDPDEQFFSENPSATPDATDFTAVSLSAGLVHQLSQYNSIAVNISHSERAPSAAEIYSNGLHIATSTFEIGAGYTIVPEEGGDENDFNLVPSANAVDTEVANNIDLTYRIQNDQVHASFSIFYNQIDNFLYLRNTGLELEDSHEEEGEEEEEGHEGEELLPIFQYTQTDAEFYGFEAQVDWHINQTFRLHTFSDLTRAKLLNSEERNLPRIPPLRFGAELHWERDSWHGEVGMINYQSQERITEFETRTSGYTLLSANVNYYLSLPNADLTFYIKGNNLTNKLAKAHTSFIKDSAPLPGRSISTGIRVNF